MRHLLVSVLTLSAANLMAAQPHTSIIYGTDDRLDLYEVQDQALADLASSTAAMIPNEKVSAFLGKTDALEELAAPFILQSHKFPGPAESFNSDDLFFSLFPPTTYYPVCEAEKFSQQVAIGNCSGFLVGESTLVTAGHCVNERTCPDDKWVFDYAIKEAGQTVPLISEQNVYACKKVIKSLSEQRNRMDYAVIELDRPVKGRKPLKFRQKGKIEVGTDLVVIGYPSGLPVKISGGAKVTSVNDVNFVSNLDTYGGNSGSAVFNLQTKEVEGILVFGARDYVFNSKDKCMVSNEVADSEAGEASTLITNVEEIKKTEEELEVEATKERILNLFADH